MSEMESGSNRDIRTLLDAMSDSLASLDLLSLRIYESAPPRRRHEHEDSGDEGGTNYRALLDSVTTRKNGDTLADRFYYHAPPPPPKEYNPTLKDQNTGPDAGASFA